MILSRRISVWTAIGPTRKGFLVLPVWWVRNQEKVSFWGFCGNFQVFIPEVPHPAHSTTFWTHSRYFLLVFYSQCNGMSVFMITSWYNNLEKRYVSAHLAVEIPQLLDLATQLVDLEFLAGRIQPGGDHCGPGRDVSAASAMARAVGVQRQFLRQFNQVPQQSTSITFRRWSC